LVRSATPKSVRAAQARRARCVDDRRAGTVHRESGVIQVIAWQLDDLSPLLASVERRDAVACV
jgi:hypothetical protein